MKNRLTIAIILIFIVQTALIILLSRSIEPTIVGGQHTPIPPLPRATLPVPSGRNPQFGLGECRVAALTLLGSWVQAGKPQSEAFPFQGTNGDACEGTFNQDVQPLFNQANIWYSGAVACTTCHGEPLDRADARLSLSRYESILAGSWRESATSNGQDILGDADSWTQSKLYIQIFTRQMPIGRSPASPPEGPVIWVGNRVVSGD